MMPSFIYGRRLFSKPVRLDFYAGFVFEAMLAVALLVIGLDVSDLSGITSGQPMVTVSPRTFQLFGLVGLYGIRVAMYVAMIRGNRSPQAPEWIVTLLGLGFAVLFFAFGGFMLTLYAGLHGYDRCPAVSLRNTEAVFVRDETPCPTKPPAL